MADLSVDAVRELLRRSGLDHTVFDVEDVTTDLNAAIKQATELDTLLEGGPSVDPSAFAVDWR